MPCARLGELNFRKRTAYPGIVLVTAGLACAAIFSAAAHDTGLSTATLSLGPNKLEAVLVFSRADAGLLAELDRNHDG